MLIWVLLLIGQVVVPLVLVLICLLLIVWLIPINISNISNSDSFWASSPVFEDISIAFSASIRLIQLLMLLVSQWVLLLLEEEPLLILDTTMLLLPTFGWTAGADDPAGNGLRGLCLLGTTVDSDPRTSAGLLTNSPINSTGTDCGAGGFIVSSTSLNLGAGSYLSSALESGTTYYIISSSHRSSR